MIPTPTSPYLRICFVTAGCAPLDDRPGVSKTSSTNEVKKTDTSVQVERLALCPAHRGMRSDRPAAFAGIERFLTSFRCNGYGKSPFLSWFNSSIKRLWIPRASFPVKPFVSAVYPAFFPRKASR